MSDSFPESENATEAPMNAWIVEAAMELAMDSAHIPAIKQIIERHFEAAFPKKMPVLDSLSRKAFYQFKGRILRTKTHRLQYVTVRIDSLEELLNAAKELETLKQSTPQEAGRE